MARYSPDNRVRNLVEAFQTALQIGLAPTYRVTGYKPLNAINVRVTYTAPMWNNEPQRAVVRLTSSGDIFDQGPLVWTARAGDTGDGREIVRFEADRLTNKYVKNIGGW